MLSKRTLRPTEHDSVNGRRAGQVERSTPRAMRHRKPKTTSRPPTMVMGGTPGLIGPRNSARTKGRTARATPTMIIVFGPFPRCGLSEVMTGAYWPSPSRRFGSVGADGQSTGTPGSRTRAAALRFVVYSPGDPGAARSPEGPAGRGKALTCRYAHDMSTGCVDALG